MVLDALRLFLNDLNFFSDSRVVFLCFFQDYSVILSYLVVKFLQCFFCSLDSILLIFLHLFFYNLQLLEIYWFLFKLILLFFQFIAMLNDFHPKLYFSKIKLEKFILKVAFQEKCYLRMELSFGKVHNYFKIRAYFNPIPFRCLVAKLISF